MKLYPSFKEVVADLRQQMKHTGHVIHTEKWQSIEIAKKPEAEMRELINVDFKVPMGSEDLDCYRDSIKPNLPWADKHFEQERASGEPINPGWTWKEWPWGHSADKFRREGEQYSHSYAERYWPKFAGMYNEKGGVLPNTDPITKWMARSVGLNHGIRYDYGDLQDVVNLLVREPLTRQAYLPVWFPEDTGVVHGERVPCTLGYHFLQRGGYLHLFYPIRSCDLVRHFQDDLYLTVRLVLWVLDQCRKQDEGYWKAVKPGMFSMWIGSLHCFVNDWRRL